MRLFLAYKKDAARETLSGFNNILKKDGLLFISVKIGEGEKIVTENKFSLETNRFFASYSKNEILKLLNNADFEIIQLTSDKKWLDIFAVKNLKKTH